MLLILLETGFQFVNLVLFRNFMRLARYNAGREGGRKTKVSAQV